MPEIIKCPSCQRQLQVPENFSGQLVQCPKCAVTFVAAGPAPAPPLPMESVEPPPLDWTPRRRRPPPPDDYDEPYYDDRRDDRFDRRDYLPHRGAAVLTLGILSLVACGILGPIAWIMGNADLREMRAGRMDPSGEQITNAGRICGIIGTCLIVVAVCFYGFFFLAFLGEQGFR